MSCTRKDLKHTLAIILHSFCLPPLALGEQSPVPSEQGSPVRSRMREGKEVYKDLG